MQISLFGKGGRAVLAAIRRQNYDTLSHRPALSKWQKGGLIFSTLAAFARRTAGREAAMSLATAASGRVGPSLAESREHCASLTKHEARNFYYGLKLLPQRKRQAMFALYAYMRLVDDIADGEDGQKRPASPRSAGCLGRGHAVGAGRPAAAGRRTHLAGVHRDGSGAQRPPPRFFRRDRRASGRTSIRRSSELSRSCENTAIA